MRAVLLYTCVFSYLCGVLQKRLARAEVSGGGVIGTRLAHLLIVVFLIGICHQSIHQSCDKGNGVSLSGDKGASGDKGEPAYKGQNPPISFESTSLEGARLHLDP